MRAIASMAPATPSLVLLSACSILVDSGQYIGRGRDAGGADGGAQDAASPDAGEVDAVTPDAEAQDAGPSDAGRVCSPECGTGTYCAEDRCAPCDADGDGYLVEACTAGGAEVDCDDTRPEVRPGAIPVCGNGVIDSCAARPLGPDIGRLPTTTVQADAPTNLSVVRGPVDPPRVDVPPDPEAVFVVFREATTDAWRVATFSYAMPQATAVSVRIEDRLQMNDIAVDAALVRNAGVDAAMGIEGVPYSFGVSTLLADMTTTMSRRIGGALIPETIPGLRWQPGSPLEIFEDARRIRTVFVNTDRKLVLWLDGAETMEVDAGREPDDTVAWLAARRNWIVAQRRRAAANVHNTVVLAIDERDVAAGVFPGARDRAALLTSPDGDELRVYVPGLETGLARYRAAPGGSVSTATMDPDEGLGVASSHVASAEIGGFQFLSYIQNGRTLLVPIEPPTGLPDGEPTDLHGVNLVGNVELAMTAHARVAADSTQVDLLVATAAPGEITVSGIRVCTVR